MKILLIGFLAFSIWSIVATKIYVCNIMGFCENSESMQVSDYKLVDANTVDSLKMSSMQENAVVPKDLIIYFAFDKSEFNSDLNTETYIDESKIYLDQNSQAKLRITGYTDAIGTIDYNQALGYRRAQSLQLYFESKGMPSQRIILKSFGEKEPANDNNTTQGRANNRRTVITINN